MLQAMNRSRVVNLIALASFSLVSQGCDDSPGSSRDRDDSAAVDAETSPADPAGDATHSQTPEPEEAPADPFESDAAVLRTLIEAATEAGVTEAQAVSWAVADRWGNITVAATADGEIDTSGRFGPGTTRTFSLQEDGSVEDTIADDGVIDEEAIRLTDIDPDVVQEAAAQARAAADGWYEKQAFLTGSALLVGHAGLSVQLGFLDLASEQFSETTSSGYDLCTYVERAIYIRLADLSVVVDETDDRRNTTQLCVDA